MSEHEPANRSAELTAFEAALAALAPRVEGFDRQRLMFLAGQASVLRERPAGRARGARWGWPAAFSAMTATAATLLVMLSIRSEPTVAARDGEPNAAGQSPAEGGAVGPAATVAGPAAARETANQAPDRGEAASADSYAELRERILRQGDDAFRLRPQALAVATAVAEGPLPYHVLLERLLQPRSGGRQ
jgi:hypothetical protein